LAALYPDSHCELDHRNPFELLVATILSAQCTDVRVNLVTPALFARFPTPADLAGAAPTDLEALIRSTGFYRNKTKALLASSRDIVQRHGGEVPDSMEALLTLQGVARKTANVVLGNAFDKNQGVVVDTHVKRLSVRMGLSTQRHPEKVERDLMGLFPSRTWCMLSHLLIWHGRRVCQARKPQCEGCGVRKDCPQIGVK
jgi:endonuclease-3